MFHIAELAAVLLLLAVGYGVTDVAPEVVRRVVRSFVIWMLVFAAAIVLFSIPCLVSAVVRLGVILVAAYVVRWWVGDAVSFYRGPHLMVIPGRGGMAEAARRVSGLPAQKCRLLAHRITCGYDEAVGLLGLAFTGPEARRKDGEKDFGEEWIEGCEKALDWARNLGARYSAYSTEERQHVSDMRFIAQALCAYEPKSVERVLGALPAPALGTRSLRVRAARELEKAGRRTTLTETLGLESPTVGSEAGAGAERFKIWMALLPAIGLSRAGYSHRAITLGISLLFLFGYGLIALLMDRGSGWVYLAVGALIHIRALFALGDFRPSLSPINGGASGRGRVR